MKTKVLSRREFDALDVTDEDLIALEEKTNLTHLYMVSPNPAPKGGFKFVRVKPEKPKPNQALRARNVAQALAEGA